MTVNQVSALAAAEVGLGLNEMLWVMLSSNSSWFLLIIRGHWALTICGIGRATC